MMMAFSYCYNSMLKRPDGPDYATSLEDVVYLPVEVLQQEQLVTVCEVAAANDPDAEVGIVFYHPDSQRFIADDLPTQPRAPSLRHDFILTNGRAPASMLADLNQSDMLSVEHQSSVFEPPPEHASQAVGLTRFRQDVLRDGHIITFNERDYAISGLKQALRHHVLIGDKLCPVVERPQLLLARGINDTSSIKLHLAYPGSLMPDGQLFSLLEFEKAQAMCPDDSDMILMIYEPDLLNVPTPKFIK